MTLDNFIGLTLQNGISIDLVLIDEASYAPLAKVLPLLSLRRPIAMLGNHLQLPPICECENNSVIRAYWAKPAIFLEDAFRFAADFEGLDYLADPNWHFTQRCILTESHRFGQSLASLLDRHIYDGIGLKGLSTDETDIRCINCRPSCQRDRKRRENISEVEAILKWLARWWEWAQRQPSTPSIAILSLYKAQVKLTRRRLESELGDTSLANWVEVLNTHQAQGREWDWVLFSVSDTEFLKGNPPFFSDSSCPVGKAVVNTTISRAKKHLRIFLDKAFWSDRVPDSILSELARDIALQDGVQDGDFLDLS